MNRDFYCSYIEEKMVTLAYRIKEKGKLNILNYHLHSENYYADLLNKLYGWSLINMNRFKQNVESIDLIDKKNKFVIQVSATSSRQKIEYSLGKDILKDYKGYTFKFVSIANECNNLRDKTFSNPHSVFFTPTNDIIDVSYLLRDIIQLDIDRMVDIYKFVSKELGERVPDSKINSNLAEVVNILSKEDLVDTSKDITINNSFDIENKIDYNNLNEIYSQLIQDNSIYQGRLSKIYKELDKIGANKSMAVLLKVRNFYIEQAKRFDDPNMIFLNVLDCVKSLILESKNFNNISIEELELCVDIIVADAFIRCKIFKNPEGYMYVITR